jgi:hypothetical protein
MRSYDPEYVIQRAEPCQDPVSIFYVLCVSRAAVVRQVIDNFHPRDAEGAERLVFSYAAETPAHKLIGTKRKYA